MNADTQAPSPALRQRIHKLLGAEPTSFVRVVGGYTPAARWLVGTRNGRFFAKIGATPSTAVLLRREFRAYEAISAPFMPTPVAWEDDPRAPLLIIEDLSRGHWPPPWRPHHVAQVRETIALMHSMTAALPTDQAIHGAWQAHWAAVAADPQPFLTLRLASDHWLQGALPALIAAEARCPTAGEALTHNDLRSDNICITPEGVKFVDWPEACRGNPRLDLGFWLPSLAYEGGPQPEAILPAAPEVAAWVAGFFAARAGLPPIPDAPRVRLVQRQQLETALPWAARALGLPPPN